jgi:regulator of sirC expression with transglutaminase-like and TPR domain
MEETPMPLSARERFAQLVSNVHEDFDLAEAALLIAQDGQPDTDVMATLHRFDELAATVRARLPENPDTATRITQLNEVLFHEEKLSGNTTDYYDPRNSFLNEVLQRKTGIPITLSVIYIEVGRRVGLPLVGVGFPGHFLVKCESPDGEIVLDPFHGGMRLSREQLEQKLREMYGDGNPFLAQIPQLLTPASKREILIRMLRNLKGVYLHQQNFTRAVQTMDWILLADPTLATEVRDRGAVQQRLGSLQAAARDFKQYLQMAPQAPDAPAIRNMIMRMTAQLN